MEENICIYKPISDHKVVAALDLCCILFHENMRGTWCVGEFTRRCTCRWGSFENRVDICMLLKILWNLIAVRVLVSPPGNELTNAILKEHPPVALNHTKFVHNSGKIIDRVSILSRVDLRHHHAVSPIFGTPIESEV